MAKIDTIGIIAPASSIKEDEGGFYGEGLDYLRSLGLKVIAAKNVLEKEELFHGSGTWVPGKPQERIDAMMELWSNPDVDALISLRGGYGCIELLDKLDYDFISKNPKPIFGYSDLTALFMAIYTKSYENLGLQLFHCPMLTELSRLNSKAKQSFSNVLESIDVDAYKEGKFRIDGPKILGGNLTLISSLIGTDYLPSFRDSILFLEDCKEPEYKIERMFYHLEHAGIFKDIQELWLGCPKETNYNVKRLEKLNLDLKTDMPYGHREKLSLVLG